MADYFTGQNRFRKQALKLGLYVEGRERVVGGKVQQETLIWPERDGGARIQDAVYSVKGGFDELEAFLDGFLLGKEYARKEGHFATEYEGDW